MDPPEQSNCHITLRHQSDDMMVGRRNMDFHLNMDRDRRIVIGIEAISNIETHEIDGHNSVWSGFL